jgi:hypothetical protein
VSQISRAIIRFTLIMLLACVPVFAQRGGSGGGVRASTSYHAAPAYGGGGWYGGRAAYPAFGFSGVYPSPGSPLDVPPRYWWVSPYPSENPCQSACNPNAGYEWDSVGTLILNTNPLQARITLDGVYAGTTDKLGPFQLPVGEHTLHIEAPGYEPSDIIVKFDQPGVQNLNVDMKRLTTSAKPAPRT